MKRYHLLVTLTHFETPELAEQGLVDWGLKDEAVENKWILCKVTKEPVKVLNERNDNES